MIEIAKSYMDTSIMRQNGKSKQPRFGAKPNPISFFSSIWNFVSDIQKEPAYSSDSRTRDAWLRKVWKLEPYLAGVLNSVVQIDKNRGWTITGGRNQVNRFTKILHQAFFTPDLTGWRQFFGGSAQAYYTSDLGSVSEIGRNGKDGPLSNLYFVDPVRCRLTGGEKSPLDYYSPVGGGQNWGRSDFFRVTSLPSTDEILNGLGYCAVSRCIELAKIMVGIYQYDNEMLLNRAPRGLMLLKGITQEQWEEAMTVRGAKLDGDEKTYYGAVNVIASMDASTELEAQLISLSQLPAEFNQQIFTDLLMYGYALIFGYDPREFWPVSSGSLGTATETETQHRKAGGKGGLDFTLGFQERLQEELPDTVHFEFEERDQDGELAEAKLTLAKVDPVMAMYDGGNGVIDRDESRILLAEQNIINPDWTITQEDVTSTDTEDIDRLLRVEEVQRAMFKFPGEPIVHYSYPQNTVEVLALPGQLKPRFYSFGKMVKRSVRRQIEQELSDYQEELNDLALLALEGEIDQEEFESRLEEITTAILILALLRGASPDEAANEAQQLLIDASLSVLDDEDTEGAMDVLEDQTVLESALPAGALTLLDQEIANSLGSTLVADIYGGLYNENAAGLVSRLGLWGVTAYGLWQAGKLFGNPEKHYRWGLGPTKEHCGDCARLNGQVHTGSEWAASGWRPASRGLECTGYNCLCSLEETDGPSVGNF